LYAAGSQAIADLVALGESLALARDLASFLQHNIWPQHDDEHGLFIEDWEEVFGLLPYGDIDARVDRLISTLRQRGTMTQDLVKAIMCRAWGSDNPNDVTITSVNLATTVDPDEDWQWAFMQTNMHIFHSAQTQEPDFGMAYDLIAKIKPTWETWSVGKAKTLKWGVHADDGEWNQRLWG
jgi:hypothetical protein